MGMRCSTAIMIILVRSLAPRLRNQTKLLAAGCSFPRSSEKSSGKMQAVALRRPAGSDAVDPPRCPVPAAAGSGAATKLQKVYLSYQTRRRLADSAVVVADSAVVVEELWWQALDFARLNYNTISFHEPKPKTVALHWNRISQNALKVGHGLSKEAKALKLAFEHWIEAIDSRHRSGHNLHFYYNLWHQSQAGQPFFYWLDVGDGKDVDLPKCPRTLLKKQCIRYLGPLGLKLSLRWSTGVGPRIGCVKDYPTELRMQAFEMVHLLTGASTIPHTLLLAQAQECHNLDNRFEA